jgi:hypothetical protein
MSESDDDDSLSEWSSNHSLSHSIDEIPFEDI